MAGRIHPALISILVVLVLVTLLFTFLVIHESGQITAITEGNPDEPNGQKITLNALMTESTDLRNKIAAAQSALASRRRGIQRADLHLNEYRFYYGSDGKVLSGVATAQTKDIDGKPLMDSVWKLGLATVSASKDRIDGLKAEHDSDARQAYPKLDEAIQQRQQQLQKELQKIQEQEAAFQEDQSRLNTQIDGLGKEKDSAERKNREDFSRRATKIGQLEDRIRQLLELELHWLKDLDSVGNILEVNPGSPYVVINLGSSDRVFPGLLLEVFNLERGRYKEKGMIEVIEVKAQIATARVLSVVDNRAFPLSKNDNLGNPVFSTTRPKVFVVTGEFDDPKKNKSPHTKEDLENFIRQTGGVVREKLSPGVDILVAGDRSDKEQDNAREFQVQAMTSDQLMKYVRQDYHPK